MADNLGILTVDDPDPTIGVVDAGASVTPFSQLAITDTNTTESISATIYVPSGYSVTANDGFTGNYGAYTISGTAAQVQAAIDAFTVQSMAGGGGIIYAFVDQADGTVAGGSSFHGTSVNLGVVTVNDPDPTTGVVDAGASVTPFSQLAITDTNTTESISATIYVPSGYSVTANDGFTGNYGAYTISGTAAQVQAAIDAFTVQSMAGGGGIIYAFVDQADGTVAGGSSFHGTPPNLGTVTVNDPGPHSPVFDAGASVKPFSKLAVTDTNTTEIFSASILVPIGYSVTASDGFTHNYGGYYYINGTAAQVQAAIDAFTVQPTAGGGGEIGVSVDAADGSNAYTGSFNGTAPPPGIVTVDNPGPTTAEVDAGVSVKPFGQLTITDTIPTEIISAIIGLPGFIMYGGYAVVADNGFTRYGTGDNPSYTVSGTAAQVQAAIDAFTVQPMGMGGGYGGGTISVSFGDSGVTGSSFTGIMPLVVVPQSLSATYGTPVTYSASQLLAGDTDPQGGTLSITAVSGDGVVLNQDGSVTYTPPSTAVTGDAASFSYTVTDAAGLSSNATATIGLSEANLLVNGTFEADPIASAAIPGWVTTPQTNFANSQGYNSPQVGGSGDSDTGGFVAFGSGEQPGGTLSQTFLTTPGQTYSLTFLYGAFGFGAPQSLEVSAGTLDTIVTSTATSNLSTLFSQHSFQFTANSANTTLTFRDVSASGVSTDGLLDSVDVEPAPSPVSGSVMVSDIDSTPATLASGQSVTPFQHLAITDTNTMENISATVTVAYGYSVTAHGGFDNNAIFSHYAGYGYYTSYGTAVQVQAAIDAFTVQSTAGGGGPIGVSVSQADGTNVYTGNFNGTAPAATPGAVSVNDPDPTSAVVDAGASVTPFSEMAITDTNTTETISAKIAVPSGYSVTANSSFANSNGSYTISGTAAQVQATIDAFTVQSKADGGGIILVTVAWANGPLFYTGLFNGTTPASIPVSYPPIVVPATLGVIYGTPVTYSASQLLAGDTDPQGGTLSITTVSGDGVVLNQDGSVTYTPPSTAVTGDAASFSYTVTDPAGLSSNATATIGLSEANLLVNGTFEADPIASAAIPGWVTTPQTNFANSQGYDSPQVGGSGDSDTGGFVAFGSGEQPGGTLSQTFLTTPGQTYSLTFLYGAFGFGAPQSLEVSAGTLDTTVTSTATANLSALFSQHSFQFTANSANTTLTFRDVSASGVSTDGLLDSVDVKPIMSAAPPIVVPETLGTTYGTPVTYSASQLLAGDTDPQGGTLGVTAVSGDGVVLNQDGSITYTPPSANAPVSGDSASFKYTVTDPAGLSSTTSADVHLSESLVVNASADIWQHSPQFIVAIDGVQQGTYTASDLHNEGPENTFTFQNLASGKHDVSFAFFNDESGGTPSLDTNLWIDTLDYQGHHYAPEVGLFSNGTIHFTVGNS